MAPKIRHIIFGLFLFLMSVVQAQDVVFSDSIKIFLPQGNIQNAIQKLSDHTGLRFAYRSRLLENVDIKSMNVKSTIGDLFEKLFTANQLCYTYQNGQIILHTNCYPKHYTIIGNIVEEGNLNPIPYVAVSLKNSQIGTIADQNGSFELDIPYSKSDTLIVSSMGYQRDTIILSPQKATGNIIVLKEKIYAIPEAYIQPKEFISSRLGNTRDRMSGSLYIDTHGQQTALFIENEKDKEGQIMSIQFYISEEGNSDTPLRIRIYNTDTAGMPCKDIIEDALVVKPGVKSGWYVVDISSLNLLMPRNGIFVALEGVFPGDYESYFGDKEFMDLANSDVTNEEKKLTYGQRIGYNRRCRENTWHYSITKVWFQLEKQAFGIMIAAIVNYEKEPDNAKLVNNE